MPGSSAKKNLCFSWLRPVYVTLTVHLRSGIRSKSSSPFVMYRAGDNKQAGNGCRTRLYFVTSGSRLETTGAAWLGKTPINVGQLKRNTATAFAIMTHKEATSTCKSHKSMTVSLFPLLEAAGVSVFCSHLLPLTSDTCHHQLTGCKQSITSCLWWSESLSLCVCRWGFTVMSDKHQL